MSNGVVELATRAVNWLQHARAEHPKKTTLAALVLLYTLYQRVKATRTKSVRGKVVLITGGASGLGKNLAQRFAALGAKVVLWDINAEALKAVGLKIAQDSGMCFVYTCDVTDRNAVYATAQRVFREVGRVDILINNAGIVSGDYITDVPDHKIELTFKVNVLAHFWTIKSFLPEMLKINSGHIVTIASVAGLGGGPKLMDYCASKAAAYNLDESLRVELAHRNMTGIKTTCICPYYINTGMFEGVSSRILPILEEDYVSRKILNAILTDTEFLVMPRLFYIVPLLRFLLPVSMFDSVVRSLGLSSSMDSFKGRLHAPAPSSNPTPSPASQ